MALDRFVQFPEERPSREEVESVLGNFFNGAARVQWVEDRFFIYFDGEPSFPFKDVTDVPPVQQQHDRWIEIFYNEKQFDVITRQQDEYTNVIANGIAQMFARYWGGKVDA